MDKDLADPRPRRRARNRITRTVHYVHGFQHNLKGNKILDVTIDCGGGKHLNEYKLLDCIGSGAFGKVNKAINNINKKTYVKNKLFRL